MPRAFHADAELEASASRDQLTERETPRAPLPNFATPTAAQPFGHCCSLLPFCPVLQRFS